MVCTRPMHKKNTGKDCDKRDNNKNNNNKYPLLALTTDSELMSSKMILLRTITIILRANDWTYCCHAVLPTNFFEGIFLDLVETLICSKRFAKLILFLYLKPFCTKTHLTLFSADLWTCWLNKVTKTKFAFLSKKTFSAASSISSGYTVLVKQTKLLSFLCSCVPDLNI